MSVFVIRYCFRPLLSTALNVHGSKASPNGLCPRTHTNGPFLCGFCCRSFKVGPTRGCNLCVQRHMAGPCSFLTISERKISYEYS